MPFPTQEQVRAAVAKALFEGLAVQGGDWFAQLPNDKEATFSPGERIEVTICLPDEELAVLPDDAPAERTFQLRVRVEIDRGK